MKTRSLIISLCITATSYAALAQDTNSISTLAINAGQVTAQVSPTFSGMMTEEINHSYDGGLYGELIQNRVFKDSATMPVHWSLVQADGATADMNLDFTNALNEELPNSLRLNVTSAADDQRAGVANSGFWGIPIQPETTYRASFYARAAGGFNGPITVTLESDDGAAVFCTANVKNVTSDWQKYSVRLTTSHDVKPTANARFILSVHSPGVVWFNLVSLFPPTWNNRPNGNRMDLMEKLSDMKPTFLRFPGGNYLEGNTIATRFPWKQTLGDLAKRPGHPCCWGYRSSDGLGLLEFLEWAEDLNAEPVLAVYAGFSLPPKKELIQPGPDLAPYVSDALDEIEYVIGDATTKWGARRAADGHPEPFKLTYVEIGNEDWFDDSGSYDARFTQFYDAIKAKYPKLQCISTVGNEQPASKLVHSRTPDVVDEHYYRPTVNFEEMAPTRFEKYDRKGPKIFVGEWAAYEDIEPWNEQSRSLPPTPGFKAAMGDAVWLLAMERNSDIIIMQCYAPMLVNVNPGARQWRPNLIGYDALNSFGSPSYYVIKMFNENRGDVVVHATLNAQASGNIVPLNYSVTKDTHNGALYIKVANVTGTPQPLQINIDGVKRVAKSGKKTEMVAALDDSNSINNPVQVVPLIESIKGLGRSFTQTFPPYSITVLKLETR